jgi:hypothetical protein
VAGVSTSFLSLAPEAFDLLRRLSYGRPPRAEADFQIANPSVHGVHISNLIIGRIFAAASLDAAPECADGRTLTGRIWSDLN